jgi:hypothetical protein
MLCISARDSPLLFAPFLPLPSPLPLPSLEFGPYRETGIQAKMSIFYDRFTGGPTWASFGPINDLIANCTPQFAEEEKGTRCRQILNCVMLGASPIITLDYGAAATILGLVSLN